VSFRDQKPKKQKKKTTATTNDEKKAEPWEELQNAQVSLQVFF
jgi:hypothetical protein